MRKNRPHDFCGECGSDLGEIPPPPPRCHHCKGMLKGHKGPWGIGRCRNDLPDPVLVHFDSFLSATLKEYGEFLDRALFNEHPARFVIREKR